MRLALLICLCAIVSLGVQASYPLKRSVGCRHTKEPPRQATQHELKADDSGKDDSVNCFHHADCTQPGEKCVWPKGTLAIMGWSELVEDDTDGRDQLTSAALSQLLDRGKRCRVTADCPYQGQICRWQQSKGVGFCKSFFQNPHASVKRFECSFDSDCPDFPEQKCQWNVTAHLWECKWVQDSVKLS
ncbi:unnamed protein product, partial [Mesorhabditis spiculigera]